MIQVKKASAGSGKTYQLTKTYLDCLFSKGNDYAYRHILAVTFTNKATAEMKSRILRKLKELSPENPRAQEMLISILHDYGAFSVCTIDKFFQQVLRAFARELGYFSAYQVELDTESIVHEAVDRILDNLSESDTELIAWLDDAVMKQLAEGKKAYLEDDLYKICKKLRKTRQSPEVLSKENLKAQRIHCDTVMNNFRKKVEELAPELIKDSGKIDYPKNNYMKKASSEVVALFENEYAEYITSYMVRDLTYSLGIAREFYNSFDEVVRDKNIMCLDDSTTLLKRIIDGSDTPFVYEKMGVRYQNFLIDEFQDTSSVQWDNFYPLLKESNDNGNESLVVGDIKQSIYRWRGSDWKLLDEKLPSQFANVNIEVLGSNYRSAKQVVEFNNRFFKFAASELGLDRLYDDVEQKVASKDSDGYVNLKFCDKSNMIPEVIESVKEALSQHARFSDIAVLVRGNKEGAAIANELIENGYPVITDDSLNANAALTVRRLVALLGCMENEENGISRFYAESLDMEYPEGYHSLVDLCESLLRSLLEKYPEDAKGEILHIQSFMDTLEDWSSSNGNNLTDFLKYWKDKEVTISSPAASESIRVMTIHKSKGLEFPFVIVPFAETVTLFKQNDVWCKYNGVEYPVVLTKKNAPYSLFKTEFEREKELQTVDNLNVFYVALTRAVKSLTVISANPSKSLEEDLNKGKKPEYSNMSQVLYAFAKTRGFTYGAPYDFDKLERKEHNEETEPSEYQSFGLGDRLSIPDDSSDFFGEDGVGTKASARLNGVVLHDILSQVIVPEDLDGAVASAVREGFISAEEGTKDKALLAEAIASHPEWFDEGAEVQNEVTVIGEDGELHRPDRVIFKEGEVIILDYKFGAHKASYRKQVGQYVRLYKAMGHNNVRGYLWYVQENTVEKI